MTATILIKIDDKDIKREGLDTKAVMDILIEAMARKCDDYNLDFDIGYNPNTITYGKSS